MADGERFFLIRIHWSICLPLPHTWTSRHFETSHVLLFLTFYVFALPLILSSLPKNNLVLEAINPSLVPSIPFAGMEEHRSLIAVSGHKFLASTPLTVMEHFIWIIGDTVFDGQYRNHCAFVVYLQKWRFGK